MTLLTIRNTAAATLLLITMAGFAQTDSDLEAQRRGIEARLAQAKANAAPGDEIVSASFFLDEEITYPSDGDSPKRGDGPYSRLLVRGVTYIDGTGAPARGPVDIAIEDDRIAGIFATYPGQEAFRPASGDREIDATGMYAMPGFINSHAHTGPYSVREFSMDYIYKLWLAHGLTTVRAVGSHRGGLTWTVGQARRIASGELSGPDVLPYAFFAPSMPTSKVVSTEDARQWVRDIVKRGARGIKLHHGSPDLLRAVIEEAREAGIPTTMHHAQIATPRANVLDTARWGLTSMEHFWYGLPEALFEKQSIQRYPNYHNYEDEEHRFQGAARIWAQAAPPWSDKWNAVMDELVDLDFTISPTFAVKEATRNVKASARQEWHDEYTMPWQWRFYTISRKSHGSFFFDWTSEDEAAAAEDYRLGMTFVNEFKNRGGRVIVGSDAGYVWCLYGFCYIREFELLQEAGLSSLEIIRAATLHGAEALGIADETGSIEPGKKADLVIVGENPLDNFKVLYGTGHLRLDDQNVIQRAGGVEYTIKDGIVYDAKQLLSDVREMVRNAKEEQGIPEGALPLQGFKQAKN
jgi:imidazolonepropionase-like amidohydrolase